MKVFVFTASLVYPCNALYVYKYLVLLSLFVVCERVTIFITFMVCIKNSISIPDSFSFWFTICRLVSYLFLNFSLLFLCFLFFYLLFSKKMWKGIILCIFKYFLNKLINFSLNLGKIVDVFPYFYSLFYVYLLISFYVVFCKLVYVYF